MANSKDLCCRCWRPNLIKRCSLRRLLYAAATVSFYAATTSATPTAPSFSATTTSSAAGWRPTATAATAVGAAHSAPPSAPSIRQPRPPPPSASTTTRTTNAPSRRQHIHPAGRERLSEPNGEMDGHYSNHNNNCNHSQRHQTETRTRIRAQSPERASRFSLHLLLTAASRSSYCCSWTDDRTRVICTSFWLITVIIMIIIVARIAAADSDAELCNKVSGYRNQPLFRIHKHRDARCFNVTDECTLTRYVHTNVATTSFNNTQHGSLAD